MTVITYLDFHLRFKPFILLDLGPNVIDTSIDNSAQHSFAYLSTIGSIALPLMHGTGKDPPLDDRKAP